MLIDGDYKVSAYKTVLVKWNFFGHEITTHQVAEEPYKEVVVPIVKDAYEGIPIDQIIKIDFALPAVFRGTLGSDVVVGVRQRTAGDTSW